MDMLKKYALFKVLQTLIKRPGTYSIRGFARIADIGTTTAKEQFDYLFSLGVVDRKIIGKTYQYTINTDSFLLKSIKIMFSLMEITKSAIVSELLMKYPSIVSITLYGSVARGIDDAKSDIDLLIITRKPIKLMPLKAEGKLDREVTFIVYMPAEWRKKAKDDKVFYERVVFDSIQLFGPKPVVT